jgi:vacuolar-type H+-ATPase subunit E/Vma4
MAKTKRRDVKKGTSTKKKSDCGCKYKYNYGGTKKDSKPELRAEIPDIMPMEEYPQHRFESGLILPEDQALMNNVSDNEWLNKFAEQNLENVDREVDSDEEKAIEGLLNLSKIDEEREKLAAINERMSNVRSFKSPKRKKKKSGGYLTGSDSDSEFPSLETMVLTTTTAYSDDGDIVYAGAEDDNATKLKHLLIAGSGVLIGASLLFSVGVSGSALLLGLGEMITNR